MANYNPKIPKGRLIQKGQVLNPRGAGAHDPDIKLIRNMTGEDLSIVMKAILGDSPESFNDLRANPKSIFIKMLVAVIDKIIERGDMNALSALLDRIFGKVKDHIHVTTEVQKMTNEELLKKVDEIKLKIKGNT